MTTWRMLSRGTTFLKPGSALLVSANLSRLMVDCAGRLGNGPEGELESVRAFKTIVSLASKFSLIPPMKSFAVSQL